MNYDYDDFARDTVFCVTNLFMLIFLLRKPPYASV